ncbi:uncharacterized protein [Phaseolus vulgaris]|uniref:uncharacterized protein n=1 Tax=Phaseolus vulgaris TaxID=3885 RepID=UPI0035CCA814
MDICFWKDSWLMGEALKNVFPRLFSISSNKHAKLSDLGSWSDGRWVWGLDWRRPFFEWEKSAADCLSQLLLGVEVVLGETDRWIWKGGGVQSYTVSSTYNLIRKDIEAVSSQELRKLWRSKAIPFAMVLAWRVLKNKLATRVNLSRRGVRLESLRLCLPSETGLVAWNTIWIGVISEIWSHRNRIIFNRGVADEKEVFALAQVKAWSWVSTSRLVSFSYSDWCLAPLECTRLVS